MGSVHLVADDEERTSEEFETKFDRLFNLNFMHDLKVVVVAKKKREEIYCHKMILCARSEYFRAMYQGGFKEADEGTLILDDCSYEAVMWLMKFFYLDQLALGDMDILPDILKISHRYNVLPCLRYIEHFLARRLTIDNVCLVLNISEQYALADLKREFVSYRFKAVKKTSAFKKLDKQTQTRLELLKTEGPLGCSRLQ